MENELKFLVYSSEFDDENINVIVQNENIWATQDAMADLFGKNKSTISRHIKNIFEEGELDEFSTVAKNATVQNEGGRSVTRELDYYNLDMIISVGYRVNSQKATRFRQWASSVLKEYMVKGFVMDDERLKQGTRLFEKDYFHELLERVRSIRSSERRIWEQLTDIFQEVSIDYDKKSDITRRFFATVQNKFHYAITGKTSAEIIFEKSDSSKENMGLQTWKNAPDGRIIKSDSIVAKNYLEEDEIKKLERTVAGYFDYVERLLENRNKLTMRDFEQSIDKFLDFQEYKILEGAGSISAGKARDKAKIEYDEFNRTQKITSDFDKEVKKIIEHHE